MVTWPLKAKYRAKNFVIVEQILHGGKIETKLNKVGGGGKYKARTSVRNQFTSPLRPKRRAYGPW